MIAARRFTYIALAVATIAIGLWVHRGAGLSPNARDIAGDALWAAMIFWWISAIAPAAARPNRAVIALAICFAVELSQLIHTPAIDSLRGTTLGHLVLGSGFDPRDLLSYAVGVLAAAGAEGLARR